MRHVVTAKDKLQRVRERERGRERRDTDRHRLSWRKIVRGKRGNFRACSYLQIGRARVIIGSGDNVHSHPTP